MKVFYNNIHPYPSSTRKDILKEKIAHPIIILLLIAGAVGTAWAVSSFGVTGGVLILIGILALPIVAVIMMYPKIGIIISLVAAHLIMWMSRLGVNFPLGTLMDGLEVLLIASFFLKQKSEKNWLIFKNPITVIILIWIIYNVLEVINPYAESKMAWLYTIRTTALVMFMYFIFLYNIRTIKFMRLIFKIWLGFSLFAAIYAFKQEHFGFFAFEQNELNSNPILTDLLFIAGHWRKFSIFSDPVTFSYNMVISTILCIVLMTGPLAKRKKIILGFLAAFFMLNMLYSGTRGAYVLVPAAMILFAIIKFNKRILVFSIIGGFLFAILVFMPTSNINIIRFQSAFRPTEDASYNLRKYNQKRIQPFIQSHPLGGGLGATGVWGQRFSPDSMLANFPPDSGYVRVAVELGWVGLFLFCCLIFIVLRTGINNYYSIDDPELKTYCLACTLIVFALHVGNYPQEALVQYPSNILFYLAIAMITATKFNDKNKMYLNG